MSPRDTRDTTPPFNNKINIKKPIIPTPYGTIPKRSKNKKSATKQFKNLPIKKCSRNNSLSAPYPCFSSLTPTPTSFFISIFNGLFNKQSNEGEKPVGFMPRSTITDKIQMSQVIDIAVSSSPMDCHDSSNEQDSCSSLSSSSSSSDSSLSSLLSFYMEDDSSRSSVTSSSSSSSETTSSVSTDILSDILCDHYVQTQMNSPPSLSDNDDDVIRDVPLETFRMFEAPNSTSTNNNTIDNTTSYENYWMTIEDEQATKEWKLIETKHPKELIKQVVAEKQVVKEKDVRVFHARDTRANAAYLRMIVAEVNMMRSQKIVGPLRPRRVLSKRLDKFMHRPSPLQSITAA
ncbi:hypothetical protein INT48_000260 [Thamnidium elegans]|uniref:Uncharacterized protein n=1 Tax=Thamnidium elegans TaxID=101142 RepID=A0A8H7SVR9_9FUNG|nr:hypothetical protein INT48_000260 [Thamnidium elegans]